MGERPESVGGGGGGGSVGGGSIGRYPITSNLINVLEMYYVPALVVLGSLGNCLSIYVVFATKMRRTPSSLYLAALAVSDTGFLVSVLIAWLSFVNVHMMNQHGFCQFFVYLTNVCSFLSPCNHMVDVQKMAGTALSIIGSIITNMYENTEEGYDLESILTHLCDTGKFLAAIINKQTNTRKAFIQPGLSNETKAILKESKVDEYLYGKDLSEKIKEAKALNKMGENLKIQQVRGGVHGRALCRRLLSPAQAVDVHDESRQDPDRRHLPRRPDDLRPGAGLHAHPAPGQRPARALPDRRGLGRRGERPQSARHPAHLRAALLRHRRAQLADREGGLARGQREDVAEGEDIGEGLAAGRASGQGHQDAADCVERILLPESAGLRDEALRLLSAEGGRDGGRAGLPDPEGLQPALQHELRHQLRPLLRERSEFSLGRRPAVQLSQEAPIARRPVKALVHQSDQRARYGYHKDKPVVLGRAHGRLREAALEGLLQDETLQPTGTERRKRNTRLLRRDGVKVKKQLYAPTMGDEGDLPRLLNGGGGADERVQSTAAAVHSYPM